ncbi:hypothetical protein EYD10_14975, partial [Varanus komodoensis]
LPEGELDGCEPDAEGSGGGLVPSPTPSVASSQEGEPEPAAADDGGGALGLRCHDDLRKVTLEVVGRYLREAASQGPAEGGGGAGKFLQGLVGRFGAPQGGAGAACADQALETLRRVGGGILDKHQLAFQGMLKKMEIKKEDDLKSVSEIASHVFSDGVTNWGRIVTLIAFGAFVAKHLKNINQESGISTLTEIITDVLVTDKREWLVNHNAWPAKAGLGPSRKGFCGSSPAPAFPLLELDWFLKRLVSGFECSHIRACQPCCFLFGAMEKTNSDVEFLEKDRGDQLLNPTCGE